MRKGRVFTPTPTPTHIHTHVHFHIHAHTHTHTQPQPQPNQHLYTSPLPDTHAHPLSSPPHRQTHTHPQPQPNQHLHPHPPTPIHTIARALHAIPASSCGDALLARVRPPARSIRSVCAASRGCARTPWTQNGPMLTRSG